MLRCGDGGEGGEGRGWRGEGRHSDCVLPSFSFVSVAFFSLCPFVWVPAL